MIRHKICILLLLYFYIELAITDDGSQITEHKKIQPPDKLILQKSNPYSKDISVVDRTAKWSKEPLELKFSGEKKSEDDLQAAAAEYGRARYLAAPSNSRQNSRNCYECNSEPWIPIEGRSLHFSSSSSHSNSLEESSHHGNKPYFKEKNHINKQYSSYHPPLDAYGAPQATFDYPRHGEVVDFMLPPPYQSQSFSGNIGSFYGDLSATYGPPSPVHRPPKTTFRSPDIQYGPPNPTYGLPKLSYGPPTQSYDHPKSSYGSSINTNNNVLNLSPPPPQHSSKHLPVNYGDPSAIISPFPSGNYGPSAPPFSPLPTYGVPSAPPTRYGPPGLPLHNYRQFPRKNILTTHLRQVSQEFQPPLPGPGIQNLPLENIPPPPLPSDSYGKPLAPVTLPLSNTQFPSVAPSDSYGAPVTGDHQHYAEPITLGSGDSDEFGRDIGFFETQHNEELKASLYKKGLTDVQVVPSVRIADYTASIEHPINLIQSPILDLNTNIQGGHQEISNSYHQGLSQSHYEQSKVSYDEQNALQNTNEGRQNSNKLSENPIVVEDTYTSASNINTTYSTSDNSTAIKRQNDNYLSSEALGRIEDNDLSTNLIQRLIFEHNFIQDPQMQIVGIQKGSIDPKKVTTKLELVKPTTDFDIWNSKNGNTISTVMVPPKPANSLLKFMNDSQKSSNKLQIIVPYLRAPQNNLEWNHSVPKSTALYNREYTTLSPVFVPPPMSTESVNLWTKFGEDIRSVESHKDQAQGFSRASTTEVYNIKDFIAKQQGKYDPYSLQKNIDDWTHQSYANRLNYGDKLPTTKLIHVKNIPPEYLTTSSSNNSPVSSELRSNFGDHNDHVSSSTDNRNFISEEIVDNLILSMDTTTRTITKGATSESTTVRTIKYIVKTPKPSWEEDRVVLSNSTHEKVYVVTPQSYTHVHTSTPATAFSMAPKIQNGKVNNASTMTRISVRVEAPSTAEGDGKKLKPIKVVYSEWPHLINNLATTTTTQKPTSRHPLFGLMDLSAYTFSPNSTVETIGGHSRVTSVVTPSITKLTSTTSAPSTNFNETVKVSPATL